ncbi:MAG: kinase-like domain-containing protein [Monoraphidium minutum]|nr:MAG: kinase-like domain-containing protein [Monoraphidium minutum]
MGCERRGPQRNISWREPISDSEPTLCESSDIDESVDQSMGAEDGLSLCGGDPAAQVQLLKAECDGWRQQAERLAQRLTVERWQRAGVAGDSVSGRDEVTRRRAHQHEHAALRALAAAADGASGAGGAAAPGPAAAANGHAAAADDGEGSPSNDAATTAAAANGGGPSRSGSLASRLPPSLEGSEDEGSEDEGGGGSGAAGAPRAPFAFPGRYGARVSALVARSAAAGWLIAPGDLELGERLGAGAFGETFRARWRGADVAVKRVRVTNDVQLASFLREIEALSGVRHPSIVPFLGVVLEDADHCWLVAEFMPGGSLASCIYATCRGGPTKSYASLPLSERMQRAVELAGAAAALHAANPPFVHRDIKPANVLIDTAGRVRLSDFGLARALSGGEGAMTGETGSYLYMSPEVMRHERYGTSADVWSFGVLLSELVTCKSPYAHAFLTPVQVALAVSSDRMRPSLPDSAHPKLRTLVQSCCEVDPAKRPPFSAIVRDLEALIPELKVKDAQLAGKGAGGIFESIRKGVQRSTSRSKLLSRSPSA